MAGQYGVAQRIGGPFGPGYAEGPTAASPYGVWKPDHPAIQILSGFSARFKAEHRLGAGLARFDRSLGTPEALVGVIARNCALDQLRRAAARARACDTLRALRPMASDARSRRAEAVLDLEKILGRVHPSHAAALVSIDLGGERIADAALRLGRSYAAVNGQVGHARTAARRVARELETA